MFAVATLVLWCKKHGYGYEIVRTRDEKKIAEGNFVVDVGGVYDETLSVLIIIRKVVRVCVRILSHMRHLGWSGKHTVQNLQVIQIALRFDTQFIMCCRCYR